MKNQVEIILKLTQKGDINKIASQYKKSFAQMRQESEKLTHAQQVLGIKGFAQIRKEAQLYQAAFNRIKKAHKEGVISTQELYQAQLKLKDRISELKRETGTWAEALSRAKKGLIALTGVGYALIKSFSAYKDFASRMAEVNTLVGLSTEQFQELSSQILDMSTRIPQTANELASALYDIVSAGVSLDDATAVLEKSSKAAIAGITDTKTAAKISLAVINAYGKSISELGDVYDTLFMTVKKGNTTFPELAQYMGEVLPFAVQGEVKFHEVSAAIAELTKAGLRTPIAATALKGALRSLIAPTDTARTTMEKLGITWKGLIPTLKELTKYADQPELMTKIVPDIEARTAVLTLLNRFKELNKTLDEFQKRAGATAEAFEIIKERDPSVKLKLLGNQVSKLAIQLGGLIATGLGPLVSYMTRFIQAVNEADKPTRILIGTLMTAGAAWALWKVGINDVYFGLKGLIIAANQAIPTLHALRTASLLAKGALAGGFVITVAFAGYEIYKAIRALKELHNIQEQNRRDMERYQETAKQYADAQYFVIASKENLLRMSEQEIQTYKEGLKNAIMYYANLKAAAQLAGKDTTEYDAKLRQLKKSIDDVLAITQKTKETEKTATLWQVQKEQAEEFKKAVQSAYNAAIKKAREYATKVADFEAQIRREHISTEDLIRRLKRGTMDELAAWEDQRAEAEEKMAAAQRALHEGNFELAKKLTNEAKNLYAGLAKEVTERSEEGHEEVKISLENATDTAVKGIKNASELMTAILQKQKEAAESMRKTYEEKAKDVKVLLDQLARPSEKDIIIDIPNKEKIMAEIEELAKPVTKYINIVTRKTKPGEEAEGKQRGGYLPGYGGGDIIPAMLEPGEFVVRKEAVRRYRSLLEKINRLQWPAYRVGGVVYTMTGTKPDILEPEPEDLDKFIVYWFGRMGFLAGERQAGFQWPVNLLGSPETEARKVYGKWRRAMNRAWGILGGYHESFITFWKRFKRWWDKQIEEHQNEIRERLQQMQKESVKMHTGGEVPAFLEPGEFVVRKEAVQKYGTSTLHAINAMRFQEGGLVPDLATKTLDLSTLLKQISNLAKIIKPKPVPAPEKKVRLELVVAGKTYEMQAERSVIERLINELSIMRAVG